MNRRYAEIFAGMLLLFIGLNALMTNAAFAGIVITLGFILFAIQYGKSVSNMQDQSRSRRLEDDRPRRAERRQVPRPIQREPEFTRRAPPPQAAAPADSAPRNGIYRHALDAARRAGIDPDHTYVLPTDVGVMVFEGDQPPVIQRTTALTSSADYIQPFIQINLPTEAAGRIKFEIIDPGNSRRLFVHEDQYRLNSGTNLLMPSARLRVSDLDNREGAWLMRVYAENTLISENEITWELATTDVVRRHLMEDGELSTDLTAEMRARLAENRLDSMSLDDLLAYQEEDEPPARAARR